ncbi:hypothetical protein PPNK14_18080 [Pectobacterium parmentieri]
MKFKKASASFLGVSQNVSSEVLPNIHPDLVEEKASIKKIHNKE